MEFFKWPRRRELAQSLPQICFAEYKKFKNISDIKEDEAAEKIFTRRYHNLGMVLSKKAKTKLRHYLATNFKVDSLFGFCLAVLDIEGNIDPSDGHLFNNMVKLIAERFKELGFKFGFEKLSLENQKAFSRSYYDYDPFDERFDVNDFVERWNRCISPHRRVFMGSSDIILIILLGICFLGVWIALQF